MHSVVREFPRRRPGLIPDGRPHPSKRTFGVAGGKQALPERLTGSETVLLLGNCEHLVESVSQWPGRFWTLRRA